MGQSLPKSQTVCPFRGLLPFREEDAPFFFGRQDYTDQLALAVERHPFVAVLGASGSGKSSVVHAGLVPRLRAGREPVWDIVTMVPTDRPLNSLVNALSPLLWPGLDDEVERRKKANQDADSLAKGALSLRDLVEIVLGNQPGTQQLLLVVDQWEELYTLCRDDEVIEYDLRLMSSLADVSSIPTEGNNLVVVAAVGEVLHFRIFDGDGKKVADSDEKGLTGRTRQIEDLRRQLQGLWPTHELTRGEKDQVNSAVTSIVGTQTIRSFTDQLLDASRTASLSVILTCRADFYGQVLGYRPLVDRISKDAQVSLGPMNETELREVIEAPAAKVGLEFEAGLTTRIFGDMGQEPGRLPLLSFLLEQLWKHRRGTLLTHEAYGAMGGVGGAIATVAEDIFARLPKCDQERLARLFIQLVSVGEESEDTRRRAPLATLGEEARPLVESLATARLLVTSSEQGVETVEVAHEALIRHWKRSQGWVNEARDFLTWRKRLKPFVDEWQKQNRTSLLQGSLLVEAQRWLAKRRPNLPDNVLAKARRWLAEPRPDLNASQREFIEASIRQHERENLATARLLVTGSVQGVVLRGWVNDAHSLLTLRKRLKPSADEWQKQNRTTLLRGNLLAEAQHWLAERPQDLDAPEREFIKASIWQQEREKQAEVRMKWIRVGYPIAVVAAFAAVVVAWRQSKIADINAVIAKQKHAQDLAAQAKDVRHNFPQRSVLLATEAVNLYRKNEVPLVSAEQSLRDSIQNLSGLGLSGHGGVITALAISPDGRWLAVGGTHGDARLWDLEAEDPGKTARVLGGHEGFVTALAISPDSRWLAVGGDVRTTRLWDLKSEDPGRTARVLAGHAGTVRALAISPDGRWLAIGGIDGTARLCDLKAEDPGKTDRVLAGHEGFVTALAISPDGRWLAVGGDDGTARLCDLKAKDPGRTARVLAGREGTVTVLAISPDGRWLAVGGDDGAAWLWDLKAEDPGRTARVLGGREGTVRALAISPDGRWLAVGGDDRTTRLWDLKAEDPGRTARVLGGREGTVTVLAISPDGRWLAIGGDDGAAWLWDLKAKDPGRTARVLAGREGTVTVLAISPDGRWLAVGGDDRTTRLCDLKAEDPGKTARVLAGHEGTVRALAISPDGRWLAIGGDDGTARLWDLKAKDPGKTDRVLADHGVLGGREGTVRALAISPDGRWLAVGGIDGTARLCDLKAKDPGKTDRVLAGHEGFVTALAISPDGRWLAVGGDDGTARLCDLKAEDPGKTDRVLAGHAGTIRALAISPDGRWLAVGGDDGTARLCDLKAEDPGRTARVLGGREGTVRALAISPDGRWLAVGGTAGTARLCDLKAEDPGRTARVLAGHAGTVRALAISPDGRWLATGSDDGTARLWDLKAEDPGKTAPVLAGHAGTVRALAISPDGRWLAIGGDDGTARLWPLTVEELLIQAERAVGRNLTLQEWEVFFRGEEYRKTFERLPAPTAVPLRP